MEVFLDNSSTTKVLPEVIESMIHSMKNSYGNASSFHSLGIISEGIIRDASRSIMKKINAHSGRIYFTSCGTESNNLAIFGGINLKSVKNIITSSIEHASVRNSMIRLKNMGANVVYINPSKDFTLSDGLIEECISEDTHFISIMHVNNETGMIFPLEKISEIRRKKCPKAIFHVDAVQSFGKIPIDVEELNIDFLSISSHKVHGPKGVGALYSSERVKLNPIFFGGSQQNGVRPGTEPVELISGFRSSVDLINIDDNFLKVKKLNEYCKNRLFKLERVLINSPHDASPYIINFSVLGLKSEVLLNFLSERGIYVSSASACSGGSKSKVLSSVGLDNDIIDSAIRVSFSVLNSFSDVDALLNGIIEAREKLIGF